MARIIFPLKSSVIIRNKHPIDVNENIILNDAAGSSCTFKVYDPAKDEIISVDEASGQTIINVTNPGNFAVGDSVEIKTNDGTFDISDVASIQITNGTITMDVALTDAAAVGNRVRRIFGVAVPMTEYGTPKLDTLDWGYRGTLLSTHASQIKGQDIDIEINFVGDGAAPGTLNARETICATIQDVKDCA